LPDRRFVGVACKDHPTHVWDTARDNLIAELPSVTPVPGGDFLPASPTVSEGGDRAAIARGDAAEVYELPGGHLLRTIRHSAPVSVVAFADAGRDLVSGAIDGSVLVTRDDGTQRAFQAPAGIDVAELLPDGRVIASDAKRHLRIYGPAGALHADLELPARVMSLQRDAGRLVALPSYASEAGPPLLIDLDGPRVVAPLEGHVGWVYAARWVSGERVLTAGADGTARLWDGATGRLLRTYGGTPRYLADATLTPDGLVIGGDADGFLQFWDAETGDKLWTLPAHKSAIGGVHLEGADIVTRGFTGEISRWRLPGAEATIDACSRHNPCAIVLR
jgi:WD40 repeat protein